MYQAYKNGSVEEIEGLEINVPPEGYVFNPITQELEFRGVYKRSSKKKEQHWQRFGLPDDWKERRAKELLLQETDEEYYDPYLEDVRQGAWDRRLCGFWFYNNGEATYITGLHCMYLEWVHIENEKNDGYPDYWESDRQFFYFMQYVIEDPRALGILYVTKRRSGKTAKSVVFILDLITRAKMKYGGIQSKTDRDASDVVFQKGVVNAFKKLPDFFQPVYDLNSTLKKNIHFVDTPTKGRAAAEARKKMGRNVVELGGMIDYRPSNETAYDGSKLHRYIGDEIYKSETIDIRERHNVVTPCLINTDREIIGKMLCTSTVEEIEGHTQTYIDFWRDSNQNNRNEITGRTTTGLYRYFLPSDQSAKRDKFGFCDVEANREAILASRKAVRNRPKEYNSLVRKEPLTIEEAFRFSSQDCLYDAMKLQDRMDFLSWQDNLYDVGDLIWKEKDKEVEFKLNKNGRFKIRYSLDNKVEFNQVKSAGSTKFPVNARRFVVGIDPYSHNTTQSGGGSKGSAYVLKKYDSLDPDNSFTFVVEYNSRPPTAAMFYEDMIKLCFFFGCKAMIENQKIGIIRYFEDRGYKPFLIHVKGRSEPGLPSGPKLKQDIAELTEEYIHHHIDKVWFPGLLEDWLKFDITDTEKFDRAMSSGYTLIGDKEIKYKKDRVVNAELNTLFRKRKIE